MYGSDHNLARDCERRGEALDKIYSLSSMTLRMYELNIGTVKPISPCAWE